MLLTSPSTGPVLTTNNYLAQNISIGIEKLWSSKSGRRGEWVNSTDRNLGWDSLYKSLAYNYKDGTLLWWLYGLWSISSLTFRNTYHLIIDVLTVNKHLYLECLHSYLGKYIAFRNLLSLIIETRLMIIQVKSLSSKVPVMFPSGLKIFLKTTLLNISHSHNHFYLCL